MNRFSGKVVMVTGAASGIGSGIARWFVEQEGAQVILSDVNPAQGEALAAELGERAHFVMHDVQSEVQWQQVVDGVIAKFGRLDVLVNNAGINAPMNIENTSYEVWQRIMAVNAGGCFLGCQNAIRVMKSQPTGGNIVNIASTTSIRTASWVCAYAASKAAVMNLTKSVALHCAEQRLPIRCNAVLPGVVMTAQVRQVLGDVGPGDASFDALLASHPMGRLVEAQEIARAVAYFACDDSSAVTGARLSVDCGQTADIY